MSAGDSSSEERRERLERLTHRALRELPQWRAPATLESRVLAEIERRAALGGSTRGGSAVGVASWPATGRALLGAGCALCVPLLWLLVPQLHAHLTRALNVPDVAHWVDTVTGTSRMFIGLVQLAARMVYLIPKDWLFGGLILTSAAYAAPIALGYLLLSPRSKVRSV